MKQKASLKSILGLSQEELAVVLGVIRGQLSMFESGKRDLPLHAMQELASIFEYKQNKKTAHKNIGVLRIKEKEQIQLQLQKEWQTNAYQEKLLERKIKVVEKLRKESLAALEVVEYLKTKDNANSQLALITQIQNRAITQLKKNNESHLMQLQLKQHAVAQQGEWLAQKMKSIHNEAPEDFV